MSTLQEVVDTCLNGTLGFLPTGCLEYTGTLNPDGYGQLTYQGRTHGAHRVAYMETIGPIPPGLELDHLCGNRACINLAHLEPVTHAENVRRGRLGACWRDRTHCSQGHEYTTGNTRLDRYGHRHCRTCSNAYSAAYKQRKREAA